MVSTAGIGTETLRQMKKDESAGDEFLSSQVRPPLDSLSHAPCTGTYTTCTGTGSTISTGTFGYPVPPDLAQLLEESTRFPPSWNTDDDKLLFLAVHQSLSSILENAIHALDQWYFATPPRLRLENRTCLRISCTGTKNTESITITDLGVGMTRADLINLLGVGRPIPPNSNGNSNNCTGNWRTTPRESSSSGDAASIISNDSKSTRQERMWHRKRFRQQQRGISFSSTISASTIDEEEEGDILHGPPHSAADVESSELTLLPISPLKNIIGGFYAAVCAVAIGVKVATKSKFDDYYEFHLGKGPSPYSNTWKEFVIIRPLGEGRIPSLETDHTQLTDIRGESGTSVTLYFQPHIQQWATQEKLLEIITKILETTQYTFAFDGFTSKEEVESLVMADEEGQDFLDMQPQNDAGLNVTSMPNIRGDVSSHGNCSTLSISSRNSDQQDMAQSSIKERARYIPVRLSLEERKLLRLVEATMNCCDYTTNVDKSFSSSTRRTHQQVKGVMNMLRGLVTASDYKAGQELEKEGAYDKYVAFLQKVFEIARRHKIMNPEKMRTEYGKLICLLQDIVQLQQQGHLDSLFLDGEVDSLISPIETVYKFLEDRKGLSLLDDKYIELATEEILATPGKSRKQIESEIRKKEKAVLILKQSHSSDLLSSDEIHMCLYSICDNNSFLNSNRVPIDKVLRFLEQHFQPALFAPGFSLAIVEGTDGSRLNHSHERQFCFALQSLTLWREIINDMFRLWAMAEDDLLNKVCPYSLQDTGQGMQRIQQSPRTYQAMQDILKRVQNSSTHQWIGSSVIHLGDHNVPNALCFIDKYTQVPGILGPIVNCLENLEKVCDDDFGIQDMIDERFGGLLSIKKEILHDFFRSAFDGSGADNFYDAGSCIDGRLTSAWNWCSQLPNKPYYIIFKLTGFQGFDGEFA